MPKRDVTQPPPSMDPEIWDAVVVPADNRMTPERIALGRKLYFEKRLSKDGTGACATCHDVSRGFTDQRETSEGIGGQLGQRNSPTTMNAFLMETMFLDGRAPSLEEQAKLPIVNPIEARRSRGRWHHQGRSPISSDVQGRVRPEAELREPRASHRRFRTHLGIP